MNKKCPFAFNRPKLSQNKLVFFLLCLVFMAVYALENLFPLYADDWGLTRNTGGKHFSTVVVEILRGLYFQYMNWGGRSFLHGIVHLLSWSGQFLADLISGLIFTGYVFLIYKLINIKRKGNVQLLAGAVLLLWLFVPSFTETVLWISGVGNYLCGAAIVLSYMYPFYLYYISEKTNDTISCSLFFFVAGIAAGWTNENLCVALFFFIVSTGWLLRKQHLAIPKWMITGLIGVCIGGAVMLLAPGNYIRAQYVNDLLGLSDKSMIENLAYRVGKAGYRYVMYISPLTFIYVVCWFFSRKQLQTGANRKRFYGSLLFLATAHIACFAMCASAIFPPRATFGIISLMIVAIGILYADMRKDNKQPYLCIIAIVLIIVAVVNYVRDYANLSYLNNEITRREAFIKRQKSNNQHYIVFDRPIILPDRYHYEDLSFDANYWLNKSYSKYQDIDSVSVIK